MKILAIETSCDETGAAVVTEENGRINLLSNILASSLPLHAKTGGIIPEVAAREQVKYITPVIEEALRGATRGVDPHNPAGFIDAIVVTVGPGLVGSLLVGVETARALSFAWKKPIIPVNHLVGHIYANFFGEKSEIEFPAIALIVSGAHTDLVLMKKHGSFKWLGGTRDDAAGEAFDKIGRLLRFAYPAGPAIASAAAKFEARNPKSELKLFPRPMINSRDFDFSFSGLKSAVLREVNRLKINKQFNNLTIQQLAYEVEKAIVDVLAAKTRRAASLYNVQSILLSGGVAANDSLRNQLEVSCYQLRVKFFAPPKNLCTDNAAMIGAAALFNKSFVPWQKIKVNPDLHF